MNELSINIDIGAANNGVFIAITNENSIVYKNAFNIYFDKNLTFSKSDRTARRHARRSYDRDRFILRLLNEILPIDSLSQSQKEIIYGLFKNRGFNYHNIEFNESLDDDVVNFLNSLDGYIFGLSKNKDEFEQVLNEIVVDHSNDEIKEILETQSQILNNIDKKNKEAIKASKNIQSLLQSIRNEIDKNNKHRISYLKDIKGLIYKDCEFIIQKSDKFDNLDEFYNFVGNIANFQTRILRRYFNNKYLDNINFDDTKLKKNIIRNINYMEYITDIQKSNKLNMLNSLKTKSALEYLKSIDPVITIPPYENRKNKNPQKCNTLILNIDKITPSLVNSAYKILNSDDFMHIRRDENGQLISINDIDENNIAKYLQRVLDVSKESLMDTALYPRTLDNNSKIFADTFRLNSDEIREFKEFARRYYNEVDSAKKGIITNDLLIPCGKNTPHKNRNKNELISALFGKNITKDDVISLEEFMLKNKIKGNKSYKGFFENLNELKKSYQNSFYHNLNNDKISDKDIQTILELYPKVAQNINNHNSVFEFKLPFDKSNLNTNINYLSQLGDIIYDEKNRGFLKTCKCHTLENLIRSGSQNAICTRLPSNSARLINGKIEMYLNRLAYEISTALKPEILQDISYISINVEMNKFSFENSASDLNLISKRQKAKEIICPYSGQKIDEINCEYDHILPRSKSLYNSRANLIPASSTANLQKGNQSYTLENLDQKYLDSIYEKIKVKNLDEFKNFIDTQMAKININKFTNFDNLSSLEQIALRHALFYKNSNSFTKALEILKLDRIKTHSNGTQKRFVNLLIQKIKDRLNSSNQNLEFSVNFINAELVSAIRNELSKEDKELQKAKIQDSHSHCIDASIVFYYANSKLINNSKGQREFKYDYNHIKPEYSNKITMQSKKYLELNSNKIARKKLFDDSVYSLVYENANMLKDKEFNILINLGLLHTKENGKKVAITSDFKSSKFYISTHKVFDLLFKAFNDSDIKLLNEIKFLDKYLCSYIRKDIFAIKNEDKSSMFFNNKNELKAPDEIDEKIKTKNIDKFYHILKANESKIIEIKDGKNILKHQEIKELFKEYFYTKQAKRSRNRSRIIYSLPIKTSSKYIIRQNGGYAGLSNSAIATKTYIDLDSKNIIKIPFFSKNILPCKIADIINIIKSKSKNIKQIYKLLVTKNLPSAITKLEFIISQANRHDIEVEFDKNKIGDYNLLDQTSRDEFIDKYLNGEFKELLGEPRDKKITIIKDTKDSLIIAYCVKQTSAMNKKIMLDNLIDEASSS